MKKVLLLLILVLLVGCESNEETEVLVINATAVEYEIVASGTYYTGKNYVVETLDYTYKMEAYFFLDGARDEDEISRIYTVYYDGITYYYGINEDKEFVQTGFEVGEVDMRLSLPFDGVPLEWFEPYTGDSEDFDLVLKDEHRKDLYFYVYGRELEVDLSELTWSKYTCLLGFDEDGELSNVTYWTFPSQHYNIYTLEEPVPLPDAILEDLGIK